MKRIIIIPVTVIVLVGACTATLLINKKKIDDKARVESGIRTIPVFVEEIKRRKMTDNFCVNGSFSAIHELCLASEGQGKVTSLLFNVGDVVSEGQLLARLDDELVKSQLSLAGANLVKAKNDLTKYESMLKSGATPAQQVEDIRLAVKRAETECTSLKKQYDNTFIKAPICGTITKRLIENGSLLMPGSMVAEIVDVSRLKFIANVSENDAAMLTRGYKVKITSALFPGVSYAGRVLSVGVKADEARRFPVEIELVNNNQHPLKSGMFGTAGFEFGSGRESLSIPRISIVGSIREPKVYVVLNNKVKLRDIRIGIATDNEVEVLEGLTEGEQVVTSGQINLDNDASVSIVNKK